MCKTGYQRLEENLADLIAEEQAKLGYRKEPVRFYYPLTSLGHFFGENNDTAEEMQQRLAAFPASVREKYGEVEITHDGGRFCIFLSDQASEYVSRNRGENTFIYELVSLLAKHGTTMEEVKDLFFRTEKTCIIEPVSNGEFDILIRFTQKDDPYYYCFKDEGCHIIYHRFLPEDYKDFDF